MVYWDNIILKGIIGLHYSGISEKRKRKEKKTQAKYGKMMTKRIIDMLQGYLNLGSRNRWRISSKCIA